MVKTKSQLVSSRAHAYSGINGRKFITIHETANKDVGADAQRHADLLSNGFSAAWHWTVDDKEAIQSFPHSVQCWHAGDGQGNGNLNSIGIEICVNADGDFKQAVKNAAELTKKIMKAEGIPQSNVVQHNRWSGKNCPTNLRNGSKGIDWADFNRMVAGTQTYVPPKTETKPESITKPSKPKWTKVSGSWTGQTLGYGEYGEPVRQLQTKMAQNDPPFYPNKGAKNNGIDGYFGDDTEDCVRRYQSYCGLDVDGLAGKSTYKSLGGKKAPNKPKPKPSKSNLPNGVYIANKPYPRGSDVEAIQKALASIYFYPNKGAKNNGVDSVYGPNTADAVRRFQSVSGLKADGKYGPDTKSALEKAIK